MINANCGKYHILMNKNRLSENIDLIFFILLFILQLFIFYSYKTDLGGDTGQYLKFSENFIDYFKNLIDGKVTLNRFPGYIIFIKILDFNFFNTISSIVKILEVDDDILRLLKKVYISLKFLT